MADLDKKLRWICIKNEDKIGLQIIIMGRNIGVRFCSVFTFVIFFIWSAQMVQGFKIEIANYEILKNQKILAQNFEFPQISVSLQEIKQSYRSGVMNLLNSKNGPKYTAFTFEMFMYPYRVYSYFDDYNQKQYLMKKVDFSQFRNINFSQTIKQQVTYNSEPKNIFETQISIRECLFSVNQTSNIEAIKDEPMIQSKSDCFSESQLYSLIPDLLTIFQDSHEMLQLQKVSEQHMLVKRYANLEQKHQQSEFLQLHLYRVNIHSFIYEARLTLMRYLLKQKIKKSDGPSSNQKALKKPNTQAQSQQNQKNKQQRNQRGQEIEERVQAIEGKDKQSSQNPLKIKLKDYFQSERHIWQSLYEQNSAILSNLFTSEKVFNIGRNTKYDYLTTKGTFYLAEVNYSECPISTHDITFRLFSQRDPNNEENQKEECTFLKIHKIHFIQEELPQPIQYVSDKSLFHRLESLSLGLLQTNQSNNSFRQRDLLIHIQTEKLNIQITYGRAWKQIRAEDRPTNLTKNDQGQYPIGKVFFLSETKVEVQNDTITLLSQIQSITTKYEEKCALQVHPFIITVDKISNELFSYCAQGSYCTIIDKECNKIGEVSLMNALGIRWEYKMNYLQGKLLSYVSLSRRSDVVYMTIPAPVDQTQIQLRRLPSGSFHHNLQFNQTQPGLYQINRTLIFSTIEYDQTTTKYEMIPTFHQISVPYQYQPPQLFQDSTYQSYSKFRENHIDYILAEKIEEIFNKFYFPDFPKTKSENPLKLLNIMNSTYFNRFFSDCIYDQTKELITFRKNWKGCKIVIKTSSLIVSDATIIPSDNSTATINDSNGDLVQQGKNSKIDQSSQFSSQRSKNSTSLSEKQLYEIFSNSGTGKNLLVVCSSRRNSAAYSKCKVKAINITQNFRDWNRNVKFFLQGGKYYQLYFFNQKFLTESNNDSFLQLLQKLGRQQYPYQNSDNHNKPADPVVESQLKSYKIHYSKLTESTEIFITLVDYEKQQLQGILKILLISVCILFPALTICCFVVFFKSYLEHILIYYGVMNVQPSFRYPLNNIALKIKMKELTQNKYVKVHKNVQVHQLGDQLINSDIKYSAECCFCLEQLKLQEQVAELYCKHEFHSKCFIDWVKSEPNTKCPLCKRAFTKTALNQFNSRINLTPSPTQSVQQFSQQNESENNFPNEIEIQFQS